MVTRSGDLDPAIIPFLMDQIPELRDADKIRESFNKESGLIGISGFSSDMRDIESKMFEGDHNATLAFNMFVDRLKKYIGQYVAVLNGVDAIVFTAGIGENSPEVREAVLNGLTWFGVDVDPEKNVFGYRGIISTDAAKVKAIVISTDEELVIARDVERLK